MKNLKLDDVEITVYRRPEGGIGVQIDTSGRPENAVGPLDLAVMLNDGDLYRNIPDDKEEAE